MPPIPSPPAADPRPACLVGYLSNRRDRLQATLEREGGALGPKVTSGPLGWGLGFYQNGEVLHKKRPLSEERTINWGEIANSVSTDCAIMHLRHPTVGGFRAENTHPFRMRSWLFAHAGTLPAFDQLRDELLSSIPDFIRRNIRGQTDSEVLFHLLLTHLYEKDALGQEGELPRSDHASQVADALATTVREVDDLCLKMDAAEPSLTCMLTNGQSLYALQRGVELCFVSRRFSGVGALALSTEHRYVLVLGGQQSPSNDYAQLTKGQMLVVDRQLSTSIIEL